MLPVVRSSDWKERLGAVLARRAAFDPAIERAAAAIVQDVAARGDAALLEYTERFDGVRPDPVAVPEGVLAASAAGLDPGWLRHLAAAADNIRRFHERQLPADWYTDDGDGVRLGQRVVPLERAGLYVPGGTAAYPSSVLMTAIPAQVAGVAEIHLASPPGRNGLPNAQVMAAAHFLGLRHVYAAGGAQAVGALAHGTESVPGVDKIVGPGSAYVTAAKRAVYGQVDIDSLAGPSEVVVLADETARADWVAWDLLAQAEHDERASAILVTTSEELARSVREHVLRIVPGQARRAILQRALADYGACIVAPDPDQAMDVVNALAPEHLELMVRHPWRALERVRHAGAIFIGAHSPEPVGDYFAGPNHVLPTGGTARYASALGVEDFVRRQSVIGYTAARLAKTAPAIAHLARAEALAAHARAVEVRLEEGAA